MVHRKGVFVCNYAQKHDEAQSSEVPTSGAGGGGTKRGVTKRGCTKRGGTKRGGGPTEDPQPSAAESEEVQPAETEPCTETATTLLQLALHMAMTPTHEFCSSCMFDKAKNHHSVRHAHTCARSGEVKS